MHLLESINANSGANRTPTLNRAAPTVSPQTPTPALLDLSGLHADLKPYVTHEPLFGTCIRAPTANILALNSTVQGIPDFIDSVNKGHELTLVRMKEALAKRDWFSFIYAHSKAWRLDALKLLGGEPYADFARHFEWEGFSNRAYLRELGSVWTGTEQPHYRADDWRETWEEVSYDSDKRFVMPRRCQNFLAKLPDEFTVWRGVENAKHVDGFAWTLDEAQARWFAHHNVSAEGFLVTGHVRKADVLAYFNDRNESEIVALPEAVTNKSVIAVAPALAA